MPRPAAQLKFAPSVGAPAVSLAAAFLEELTRAHLKNKDIAHETDARHAAGERAAYHEDLGAPR